MGGRATGRGPRQRAPAPSGPQCTWRSRLAGLRAAAAGLDGRAGHSRSSESGPFRRRRPRRRGDRQPGPTGAGTAPGDRHLRPGRASGPAKAEPGSGGVERGRFGVVGYGRCAGCRATVVGRNNISRQLPSRAEHSAHRRRDCGEREDMLPSKVMISVDPSRLQAAGRGDLPAAGRAHGFSELLHGIMCGLAREPGRGGEYRRDIGPI
jgi:hypothetical protein